jgi:hypothetical protein
MDTQSFPTPEQRPGGALPDQLSGNVTPEQVIQPAAAEAGVSGAAPQNSGAPAGKPTLTAQDVAAAIAAVPMPTAPVQAGAPATAADVDLVEPEWVAAAEQAITQNAANPYAEEEAVERLQVDYLKKRYGHEVKKPEDS